VARGAAVVQHPFLFLLILFVASVPPFLPVVAVARGRETVLVVAVVDSGPEVERRLSKDTHTPINGVVILTSLLSLS